MGLAFARKDTKVKFAKTRNKVFFVDGQFSIFILASVVWRMIVAGWH